MLKVSDGTDDFALLAIPFFILAGAIMAEGGMAERLVNLAKIFVGFIRGGLALVNILASAFFGCISGSSVADTASIGSVMIPQMIKHGYPRLFAVNVTVAGSLQPLLIPPSHNAVIYSLAAGGTISIPALFLAGAIPGFLLGISLMVLCLIIARRNNFPKGEPVKLAAVPQDRCSTRSGACSPSSSSSAASSARVFTPTESAAVACDLRLPGDDVHLPRLPLAGPAGADRPRGAHRRHRHDHDRLLGRLRLHDGDHAGAGQGGRVLPLDRRQQVHAPPPHQRPPPGARHVHGPRADAPHLHADLPADRQDVRHRSGAFRHHHDPQSRHRPADAAGRADAGGRLRDRQGVDGGGVAEHPRLLHPDADRARCSSPTCPRFRFGCRACSCNRSAHGLRTRAGSRP